MSTFFTAETGLSLTIPESMKKAVFEPFQCSDESHTAKNGSGLGLAIARRIMELHGGSLYIDSSIPNCTKAFVAQSGKRQSTDFR